MMEAAREACEGETRLLGVTVVTSSNETTLEETGQNGPVRDQVLRLAALARESGLDGVVCSAHEIERLRQEFGNDFILMVPGIRPAGSASQDQKRVMSPLEAMEKGATHLVIGRPITGADNSETAASAILDEIKAVR